MSRGLIEGINRLNKVKSFNNSSISNSDDQDSNMEISTVLDEENERKFEEAVQEHENVRKTFAEVPRNLISIKNATKGQPLSNSDGSQMERGFTPRKIS